MLTGAFFDVLFACSIFGSLFAMFVFEVRHLIIKSYETNMYWPILAITTGWRDKNPPLTASSSPLSIAMQVQLPYGILKSDIYFGVI